MGKIKLYVISGFLGAGKTTFLKELLKNFEDRKLGVIINEFGVIGVDGKTINRNGIEYVEVNNGSIFCSCLKSNFVKTLVELQKEDIDILIIENSGLADPSTMNRLLAEMERFMERGYDYQGAICLVDAVSFLDYLDILPPLENQVLSSNFIIINKTDLADEAAVAEVAARIKEINSTAYLMTTVQAKVPMEILEYNLYNAGYDGETSNQPWNRPAAYTLAAKGNYKREALERFVRALKDKALRIKGFIQTDAGWVHIDAVGDCYQINSVKDVDDELVQKRGVVIIGKDAVSFEELVADRWQQLMGEEAVFFET